MERPTSGERSRDVGSFSAVRREQGIAGLKGANGTRVGIEEILNQFDRVLACEAAGKAGRFTSMLCREGMWA